MHETTRTPKTRNNAQLPLEEINSNYFKEDTRLSFKNGLSNHILGTRSTNNLHRASYRYDPDALGRQEISKEQLQSQALLFGSSRLSILSSSSKGPGTALEELFQKNAENSQENKRQVSETEPDDLETIRMKLAQTKKEKEGLLRENKHLHEEISSLQQQQRHMISGFSNTSSSFPMQNELVGQISEFMKYDCEEIYYDYLSEKVSHSHIAEFFSICISFVSKSINTHFAQAELILKETGCLESLEGPLFNCMKKAYQPQWKNIRNKCFPDATVSLFVKELSSNFDLKSPDFLIKGLDFIKRMSELSLCMKLIDPELVFNLEELGKNTSYQSLQHNPIDGFLKATSKVITLIPSVRKLKPEGDLILKSLVIEFPVQS